MGLFFACEKTGIPTLELAVRSVGKPTGASATPPGNPSQRQQQHQLQHQLHKPSQSLAS